MSRYLLPALAVLAAVVLAALPASAQQGEPQRIAFAGGELTITETPDYEKVLAFDGRELAREYQVFFNRIAEVGDTEVAFFSVGPGGNACAPAALMVWRQQDGEVATATFDEDCATPAPAVTDDEVFFVPYLLPGQSAEVKAWSPDRGFRMHGTLAFAPEPDTDWASLDAADAYPLDLFRNAAVHAAAQALLGDAFGEVATGLGTAGMLDTTPGGLVWGRGCVPHACGISDTLVVVDTKARSIFFAQQGEPVRFWPERAAWPADAAALIPADF